MPNTHCKTEDHGAKHYGGVGREPSSDVLQFSGVRKFQIFMQTHSLLFS